MACENKHFFLSFFSTYSHIRNAFSWRFLLNLEQSGRFPKWVLCSLQNSRVEKHKFKTLSIWWNATKAVISFDRNLSRGRQSRSYDYERFKVDYPQVYVTVKERMLDARSIYKWAKLKTVFATSILSKKICDVWGRIYVESLCFRLCRRDASLKNRFKEDSRFSRLPITLCKYIILRSLLRVKTRMYRNRYGYIPEEINVFFVHMAPFVVTWSHLGRKVRFLCRAQLQMWTNLTYSRATTD